jgi:hypothetical protein
MAKPKKVVAFSLFFSGNYLRQNKSTFKKTIRFWNA